MWRAERREGVSLGGGGIVGGRTVVVDQVERMRWIREEGCGCGCGGVDISCAGFVKMLNVDCSASLY